MTRETSHAACAVAAGKQLSNRGALQLGILIGCILIIFAASAGKGLQSPEGATGAQKADFANPVNETLGQGGRGEGFLTHSSAALGIDHIGFLTSQGGLSKASDISIEGMQLGRCAGDYVCHDFQTMILAGNMQTPASMPQPVRTSLDRECAAKDLKVMTLIEHYGDTGEMNPHELAQAAMTMIDARSICAGGQVAQALDQYDRLLSTGLLASVK